MGATITHEDFAGRDSPEEDIDESPHRPSEMYMKGGRDTVLLAWGVVVFVIAGFILCAAAAGQPPAPTTVAAPGP